MKAVNIKQILIQSAKAIGLELLILFAVLFTINNYIGNVDRRISSDGIGYYDYLPSLFIHQDFSRKDFPVDLNDSHYSRINDLGMYVEFKDRWVNKYPSGTALLQSPFFFVAKSLTNRTGAMDDGYQSEFQRSVFYATLFYLFLSLIFFKLLLKSYSITATVILLSQVLLVFSTSVLNYVNFESAFSHIYSLFAITAFLYVTRIYFTQKKLNYFLWACLLLGLIFILRQVNILIFFFLPFIAGNWSNFRDGVVLIFKKKYYLIGGVLLFLSVACIQFYLWYLQTGHFWVYSYQGESFDFKNPELFNILFSYKKGLFVYTPVLLFGMIGVFYYLKKKEFYLFTTWILFFTFLTYILSSWWSWYYGCSYGLRAYIDYYPIFFIPFALFMNQINRKLGFVLGLISFITIPISVIQTYQYKEYILHWIDMDKEKFWTVFLKTDEQFKGLVWKERYTQDKIELIREWKVGNVEKEMNTYDSFAIIALDSINRINEVNLIEIQLNSEFKSTDNSKILVSIDNRSTGENLFWNNRSVLQFQEKGINRTHTGTYFFKFDPITETENIELSLLLETQSDNRILRNVVVKFYKII